MDIFINEMLEIVNKNIVTSPLYYSEREMLRRKKNTKQNHVSFWNGPLLWCAVIFLNVYKLGLPQLIILLTEQVARSNVSLM